MEWDDRNLKMFQGPPDGALSEEVALLDSKLSLFTGNEKKLGEEDIHPQNKLTLFRYDFYSHDQFQLAYNITNNH